MKTLNATQVTAKDQNASHTKNFGRNEPTPGDFGGSERLLGTAHISRRDVRGCLLAPLALHH